MMTKYSLEVIASTGFGVEAKAFSDPDGVFPDMVSNISSFLKHVELSTTNFTTQKRYIKKCFDHQSYFSTGCQDDENRKIQAINN